MFRLISSTADEILFGFFENFPKRIEHTLDGKDHFKDGVFTILETRKFVLLIIVVKIHKCMRLSSNTLVLSSN